MSWSVGPYLMIVAFVVSILKTTHFFYYKSQKRIAQSVEELLTDDYSVSMNSDRLSKSTLEDQSKKSNDSWNKEK